MIRCSLAKSRFFLLVISILSPLSGVGEVYRLPAAGDELIGQIKYATASDEDTLIDMARENSLGQEEIVMANPTVDRWLPKGGTKVLIPRQFILPDAPRSGIVLNIPEMRLYYFPGGTAPAATRAPVPVKAQPVAVSGSRHQTTRIARKSGAGSEPVAKRPAAAELREPVWVNTAPSRDVVTYPVSIGRMDWRTPLGATQVVQKVKDPSWHPPESIKKEHAKDGDILPDVVPPGPNNPLGQFAMKLGVPGYLIHGTDVDKAYGIGMRVTHGCIRMYPEDIAKLFPLVNVGTPVRLVNQPVKLGWLEGELYMEVHQPLDEDRMSYGELRDLAMGLIDKKTAGRPVSINGAALKQELEHPTGVPVQISGLASVSESVDRIGSRSVQEEATAAPVSSGYAAPAEPAPVRALESEGLENTDASRFEPAHVPETMDADDVEDAEDAMSDPGI